jgi:hypothetical protein
MKGKWPTRHLSLSCLRATKETTKEATILKSCVNGSNFEFTQSLVSLLIDNVIVGLMIVYYCLFIDNQDKPSIDAN